MKKFLAIGLVASLTSVSFVAPASANNEGWGTIIGVIGGALAGDKIGKGDVGAVIIGAIAGGILGNAIGKRLDKNERKAYSRGYMDAMNSNRVGHRQKWSGRSHGGRNGYYGEFIIIRQGYHQQTRQVCNEYKSVVYDRNGYQKEVHQGYSCRTSTTWTEVDANYVVFGKPAARTMACRVMNARGEVFSGRGSNRQVALDRAFKNCFKVSRFCEDMTYRDWMSGDGPNAGSYRRCQRVN